MVIDEPFNAEYYQHLLSSLVLNSRTLITELTTIAERSTDEAAEIVEIIETRIKKCLPQYKLFAIYLLDSICKNVGNPYNGLFGGKLYTIFTETYLVVTDTPTRQHLINLFKTWTTAKTQAGVELFPASTIQKIEEFIIKATSISQNNQPNFSVKLTPDMLLREGNCLLQYIIMLNNELDKLPQGNEKVQEFSSINYRLRNNIVSQINTVSDSILTNSKVDFEANVSKFHQELQAARRLIDDQSFKQGQFVKNLQLDQAKGNFQIKIDLVPNKKYFNFGFDADKDPDFKAVIQAWGKPISDLETVTHNSEGNPEGNPEGNTNQPTQIPSTPEKQLPSTPLPNPNLEPVPLSKSLGMNIESISFFDSFLGSPKNEVAKPSLTEPEADSYDPENSIVPEAQPPSTASDANSSTLKRKNSSGTQVIKKVRFNI